MICSQLTAVEEELCSSFLLVLLRVQYFQPRYKSLSEFVLYVKGGVPAAAGSIFALSLAMKIGRQPGKLKLLQLYNWHDAAKLTQQSLIVPEPSQSSYRLPYLTYIFNQGHGGTPEQPTSAVIISRPSNPVNAIKPDYIKYH